MPLRLKAFAISGTQQPDAMRKPLARGRSLIVHGRCGLEVQYDHGTLAVLSNLDMRRAHGVSRRVAEDQIDIRRVEVARPPAALPPSPSIMPTLQTSPSADIRWAMNRL